MTYFNKNTKSHIQTLCKTIGPRLNRIAQSWGCSRELANDLAQETCMIALDKHHQLRNPEVMASWMVSIMNNCHKRYIRDKRDVSDIDNHSLFSSDNPENNIDQENILLRVQHAISKLNEEQRKVLTLVDMEGMSYIETANALDLKIGTVMSRLARARSKLKVFLKATLENTISTKSEIGVIRKIK